MPTGGGKSITFQVAALTMKGVCLVITPLIALMEDQVGNLRRLGIQASCIHSGMSSSEITQELARCTQGHTKFLYVSPERLTSEAFKSKLRLMDICLLVVDESHCISQWGYDFRPAYLHIADIRSLFPQAPVLALTATATPTVCDEIQCRLLFKEKHLLRTSFIRPNLSYTVRRTENKLYTLLYILNRVPGTAIVYARNRKLTKEVALYLQQAGISANYFHAGLTQEEKNRRQTLWKQDQCRVIVATNAFGMGIDKPNVRLVVHLDMPGSLEEYFQEAGRAGRDEQKAYAVALCSSTDNARLENRVAEEYPERAFIKQLYETLCLHYQIAEGEGAGSIHHFSLVDFCTAHQLYPLQVHAALKLLELSDYIEYQEEQNETVHPVPSQIIYQQPRVRKRDLLIPASIYEERMSRTEQRIKKVLEYLDSERICRQRLLLSYFGEQATADCGCCDNCLSHKEEVLTDQEFNAIRSLLVARLSQQPAIALPKLTESLPFPAEKVIQVIRFLVEHENDRFQLEAGEIRLKTR